MRNRRGPTLLLGLVLSSCSAEVIEDAYETLEVSLTGPDAASPLVSSENDPFARTQQYLVRLSFFEDAAATKPFGQSTGSPQAPVEKTFPASQTKFDLGKISLPPLSGAHSIFVRAEVSGQVLPSLNVVARARCPVVELTRGTGKKTCGAFFGATGAWAPLRPLSKPRHAFAAAALPDGRVVVGGGVPADAATPPVAPATALDTVEVWDPAGGTWTTLAERLSAPRYGLTATVTESGTVVFAGGYLTDGTPIDAVDFYKPGASGTGTVVPADSDKRLRIPRGGHAAALLRDETVVVACGARTNTNPPQGPDAAYAAEKLVGAAIPEGVAIPSLASVRVNGCMAQAKRGLLAFCGGASDGVSCFSYDGTTAFTSAGVLTVPRPNGVRCAAPGDGSVVFVGGAAPNASGAPDTASKFIEVWKDGSMGANPFGQLLYGLHGHAVAAAGGKVLVTGGWRAVAAGTTPTYLRSMFVIDPAQAPASAIAPVEGVTLLEAHAGHELVARPDGSLVAIGGRQAGGTAPGVEIYMLP